MKRLAVCVSGGGSNLQAIIDAIDSGFIKGAEIGVVISSKTDNDALERARRHGIATVSIVQKSTDPSYQLQLLTALRDARTDYIVLAGYLAILPATIIQHYDNRIINIHPSLLPAFGGKGFYGERVHAAVYYSGVKLTGATVHFVDSGIDSGRIIIQQAIAITAQDTIQSIAKKVLAIEHRILPRAVDALVNGDVEWLAERPFIKGDNDEKTRVD